MTQNILKIGGNVAKKRSPAPRKQYPLVEIDPAYCGIYKNGCDGPYTVRRKIYEDNDGVNDLFYVNMEGERVYVRRSSSQDEFQFVTWHSYILKTEDGSEVLCNYCHTWGPREVAHFTGTDSNYNKLYWCGCAVAEKTPASRGREKG